MSFISRNNCITLEDIDLETNLIGVLLNNKYLTYSWIGGCWFWMDCDDNTLSMLDYNKEFIIEHIVEQTYIDEMKHRE